MAAVVLVLVAYLGVMLTVLSVASYITSRVLDREWKQGRPYSDVPAYAPRHRTHYVGKHRRGRPRYVPLADLLRPTA